MDSLSIYRVWCSNQMLTGYVFIYISDALWMNNLSIWFLLIFCVLVPGLHSRYSCALLDERFVLCSISSDNVFGMFLMFPHNFCQHHVLFLGLLLMHSKKGFWNICQVRFLMYGDEIKEGLFIYLFIYSWDADYGNSIPPTHFLSFYIYFFI
jgi:hypothetical protein